MCRELAQREKSLETFFRVLIGGSRARHRRFIDRPRPFFQDFFSSVIRCFFHSLSWSLGRYSWTEMSVFSQMFTCSEAGFVRFISFFTALGTMTLLRMALLIASLISVNSSPSLLIRICCFDGCDVAHQ